MPSSTSLVTVGGGLAWTTLATTEKNVTIQLIRGGALEVVVTNGTAPTGTAVSQGMVIDSRVCRTLNLEGIGDSNVYARPAPFAPDSNDLEVIVFLNSQP